MIRPCERLKTSRENCRETTLMPAFAQDICGWDVATFLDKAKITIQGGNPHGPVVYSQSRGQSLLPALGANYLEKLGGGAA